MGSFQHRSYEKLSGSDYKENDSGCLKGFEKEEYTADNEFQSQQ